MPNTIIISLIEDGLTSPYKRNFRFVYLIFYGQTPRELSIFSKDCSNTPWLVSLQLYFDPYVHAELEDSPTSEEDQCIYTLS